MAGVRHAVPRPLVVLTLNVVGQWQLGKTPAP
jgi:hypothetical protein